MSRNKRIRGRKLTRKKARQNSLSLYLDGLAASLETMRAKQQAIADIFSAGFARIGRIGQFSIFVASALLSVVAAWHLLSFHQYAIDLQIKKTGYGIGLGLFLLVILPGLFVVYPLTLAVSLAMCLRYSPRARAAIGIILPWLVLLALYAPALLSLT